MTYTSKIICGAAVCLALLMPAVAQMPGAQATGPIGKPVVYKTVEGRQLHVYISSPPEESTALHPAIVFFHGGGWTGGSVTQFNHQSAALAARGMVAIDVEYRLIPKLPNTEPPRICVEDAKSAIRWVREHAKELHIDPNKIVGSGGSAGGYLAAAAALVPEWDDPTDDKSVSAKPNVLVLFFPALAIDPTSAVEQRFGFDPKYAPEVYLSPTAPPTIIFAGGDDKLVKPDSLRHYKSLADKAGAHCELIFYDGQGHGFANKEPYTTITLTAAEHFLESLGYLKPVTETK